MLAAYQIWLRLRLEELRYHVRTVVRRYLRKLFEFIIDDLDMMDAVHSARSSVAFAKDQLKGAAVFKARHLLYPAVLPPAPFGENDLFLEFGVFRGVSLNRCAALRPDVRWYGFDSFEGLPEAWGAGARKGSFSLGGKLPPVRDNVTLIKGLFENTLPEFVAAHRQRKVAFLHVDCDLYSATTTIFDQIGDMLRDDCVIVFDELFNYRGWEAGEYKAFTEFVARKGCTFDYIAYVNTGLQVALRLTGAGSPGSKSS